MAEYPLYKDLANIVQSMNTGNFGLWYNKFIPVSNFQTCKPSDSSDDRGNDKKPVEHYHSKYERLRKDPIISSLLDNKHREQKDFCDSCSSSYETIEFKARLESPLITGIGESHPHEVSMVFDHTLGIPYIPASGIKGIVRFAHTLGLIDSIPEGKLIERDKNGNPCSPYFDDEEDWTGVSKLFGTQANRGSVIFLDAYPESVPDLHVDIMNPHYSEYYNGDKPPADYLNPVPLKFLTVSKGNTFVFRAIVDKTADDLKTKVVNAFRKALTVEGVGAKTAVGYGRFETIEELAPNIKVKKPINEEKRIDKYTAKIKSQRPTDAGRIGSIIDEALKKIESEEDKKAFAKVVKDHLGKEFKKSKAKEKLKMFLES